MEQSKLSPDWASAADIGHHFGLPGPAVDQVLEGEGLWDARQGTPTERALAEGWAAAGPLADGRGQTRWSVPKVEGLLKRSHAPLSKAEIAFESFLREFLQHEREAQAVGGDAILRRYIQEELPRYRGTAAEVVASVCQRLDVASRTDEFVALIAPAETSRTASTLSGEPQEAQGD